MICSQDCAILVRVSGKDAKRQRSRRHGETRLNVCSGALRHQGFEALQHLGAYCHAICHSMSDEVNVRCAAGKEKCASTNARLHTVVAVASVRLLVFRY